MLRKLQTVLPQSWTPLHGRVIGNQERFILVHRQALSRLRVFPASAKVAQRVASSAFQDEKVKVTDSRMKQKIPYWGFTHRLQSTEKKTV